MFSNLSYLKMPTIEIALVVASNRGYLLDFLAPAELLECLWVDR